MPIAVLLFISAESLFPDFKKIPDKVDNNNPCSEDFLITCISPFSQYCFARERSSFQKAVEARLWQMDAI